MSLATPGGLLTVAVPERLATLRVLVTGFALAYLVVRFPHLVDIARLSDAAPGRFDPVGPLVLLAGPVSPPVAIIVLATTLAAGMASVAGWRWRVSGPVFALGVLLVLSYRNSWGQVFHTENLLVLHLGILAVAPASDAWSLDNRRRGRSGGVSPPAPSTRYGWPAQLMVVVVVVAYVLAGWAKLRASGVGWADGDALRNLVAHDALRKELVGDRGSPIGIVALRHAWVFAPMAALSLAVELLAPVALLGGRVRMAWVVAAWVFHLGVLAVMGILFPYQLLGVGFACFVAVESIPARWRARSVGRGILAR
ncbi:MAG: HTTM domain-containing protein [Acidimicrobiales bacterium]|nr:HTTM domain-containing protein [Acidimicrobiales bacterium]